MVLNENNNTIIKDLVKNFKTFCLRQAVRIFKISFHCTVVLLLAPKGGFYSEGTDVFFISPNRWTKLFS